MVNIPDRILVFQGKVLEFVENQTQYILYTAIAIYTVVFSYFTVVKHFAFETFAGDLGIFEQGLWSTLKYGLILYNTPELGSHFGIHFDPILYLLLPIYSVYPSPLTLLVLQTFFLSLGAVPIFWLARDELKSNKAGLVFAILYLLYPSVQGVNWYDFHPECLAPVLLIAAFYYFKKEKFIRYFILITLAMMCKEIIPLIIVFMGIYGIWINRKKILKRPIPNLKELLTDKSIISSLLTIGAGSVWFILAGRIINSFRVSNYNLFSPFNPFSSWFYLGWSVWDILLSFIIRPLYVLQIAFTPFYSKVFYLIVLFGPLAFLSLLNLPSLLISLPWFAPAMLSLNPNYFQPVGNQYPALLIPFIFISAVYGTKTIIPVLRNLAREDTENSIKSRIMKNKYIRKKVSFVANRPLGVMFILLLFCGVIFFIGWSPLGTFPKATFHDQALEMVVYTIPPYSTVATQNEIFPHMSHNLNAYPVYHPLIEYDYILVDITSIYYYLPPIFGQYGSPVTPVAYSSVVPELIDNGTYGVVISINGIMLLKRGYTGPTLINL
ncbi:MAG: DUF2079 domain-containing protein [Candidatus Lokiarchaeia archaeon]